jgi:glycosyltransferase involved in cell wall biosynthesis
MEGISIVICCYNSEARIGETLVFLSRLNTKNINCEIILIDNNSNDKTVETVEEIWTSLNSTIPLSIHKEHKPGLQFARTKGIKESKFPFILFCDDDNWLEQDYLIKANKILNSIPNIGMLGGRGIPEFESKAVPEWFNHFLQFFAVNQQHKASGDVTISRGFVYGAGAIIRKSIFVELLTKNFTFILEDRKGSTLSAGGDTELGYCISLLGYKIYYEDTMTFRHFITSKRVDFNYILKLMYGFGQADARLLAYDFVRSNYFNLNNPNPTKGTYKLKIYIKIIKHFLRSITSLNHIVRKLRLAYCYKLMGLIKEYDRKKLLNNIKHIEKYLLNK